MEEIFLRPYQQQFIVDVRSEFRQNHKRVVGVAPCGAGKTIMTGWMIREVGQRGKRAIFFVHRQELIKQTSETFKNLGIEHGIISAGYKMRPELPVQIASVQTLVRRLDKIPAPDFLVCDECHHILANSYKEILDAYPEAFLLGVTATPQRTGGINLGEVFSSMVEGPSVNDLIGLGHLTKFKYFSTTESLELHDVRIKFGEFVNADLAKVMANQKIIGGIVDNYKRLANGKSAICYCVNVKHSKLVAESFKAAGISAAHCDGETPKAARERLVEDFRVGKIKILCNAELFSEGFDVPNMQAVILARPTKSLTLYIQQAMRPMRPDPDDPNKVAIIIDHVQNFSRFGLPDAMHAWSLAPNPLKEEGSPPLKTCPDCGLVVPAGSRACPDCKYEFVTEEDELARLTEHEGILHVIEHEPKVSVQNTRRVIHAPKTPEDFMEIAKARNYQIGWVAFQSLNFASSYEDCVHIAEVCGYKKGWAYYRWRDREKVLASTDDIYRTGPHIRRVAL